MGILRFLYDLDYDPSDTSNPNGIYLAYDFIPAGKTGIPQMSMTRDWGRRESITSIPEMDSVLSGHGRRSGPTDVRYITFGFRVIVGPGGDIDAAYDLLAAQVAPGEPQRLVYQTDAGALWYTIGYNPSIKQTTVADNRAMTAYVDFSVTWRIRPDWRPRFSEASDVWGNSDGVWGTGDGLWGGTFYVPLSSNPATFAIDARGTAGVNLPTLPDRGPLITITGPFGGAGGMTLANANAFVRDTNGVRQPVVFALPTKLTSVSQSYVLDCAAQRFIGPNGPFRPVKASYQPFYFEIVPGIINNISLTGVGASPVTGGGIIIDWWRKKA